MARSPWCTSKRMRMRGMGLALLCALACGGGETETRRPPDIMLVVLDTVRADRLMPYGYRLGTSYQLRNLAREGVLFGDVTAPAPWTWPSHASLFTGEPPWVHGAHFRPKGRGKAPVTSLRSDLPTLAERLSTGGYRTVALSANKLLKRELGLTRGFQRVEIGGDREVVSMAVHELEGGDDTPLFLFVNLMSAHEPYLIAPGVPWSERHEQTLATADWTEPFRMEEDGTPGLTISKQRNSDDLTLEQAYGGWRLELADPDRRLVGDLYDGELVRLDGALRDLVAAWNAAGNASDVLIVTSDHGEYLGEHHLLGHGRTLLREVLQVPLVLVAPGVVPEGDRVETPVQLQDLHSTILELAGLEVRPERSLLRAVEGEPRPGPILAACWKDPTWTKRLGGRFATGYRYYRVGDRAVVLRDDGEFDSYDLSKDPGMEHPLPREQGEALARVAEECFPDSAAGPQDPAVQEHLRQQLEELGYLSP